MSRSFGSGGKKGENGDFVSSIDIELTEKQTKDNLCNACDAGT